VNDLTLPLYTNFLKKEHTSGPEKTVLDE